MKALKYTSMLLGILCLSSSGTAHAGGNLVMNPGFETGDFTDWSLSGNTQDTLVTDRNYAAKGAASYAPHGGNDYALLGPVGSIGSMSQTIATTVGQSYTLSWWLGSDGDFENEFSASWNGTQVLDQKDMPTQGYVQYSFTLQATSNATVIQFGYRDDPGYLSLDDVSVTAVLNGLAVPEPSSVILAGIGGITIAACSLRSRRQQSAS